MSPAPKANEIAKEFADGCSAQELIKCFKEFKRLMKLGLQEDGHDMPCIPSYGTDNPIVIRLRRMLDPPSRSAFLTSSV